MVSQLSTLRHAAPDVQPQTDSLSGQSDADGGSPGAMTTGLEGPVCAPGAPSADRARDRHRLNAGHRQRPGAHREHCEGGTGRAGPVGPLPTSCLGEGHADRPKPSPEFSLVRAREQRCGEEDSVVHESRFCGPWEAMWRSRAPRCDTGCRMGLRPAYGRREGGVADSSSSAGGCERPGLRSGEPPWLGGRISATKRSGSVHPGDKSARHPVAPARRWDGPQQKRAVSGRVRRGRGVTSNA